MSKFTKKKIEIMQAFVDGKIIESRLIGDYDNWNSWGNGSDEPNWNWEYLEYRVKELTKPSIEWSHVSDKFNWMATDEDGETYLFENEPSLKNYDAAVWSNRENSEITRTNHFKSFKPGDCDWKDSLVKRA